MAIEILSRVRVGSANGGYYHRIKHASTSTQTDMIFGLYLPRRFNDIFYPLPASSTTPTTTTTSTPVLFWLSGLTCDDTNFAQKAGSRAFVQAEHYDMAIVMPDTSPRHDPTVPNVESYDLGIGAGFYINATQAPYQTHYQMYTYITQELPTLLEREFHIGTNGLKSISGQ
jgi:S-formylglutathione hydrolase FrmB